MLPKHISNDHIIAQGVAVVVSKILDGIGNSNLECLFSSFEDIHKILSAYEQQAAVAVSYNIKNQCVYRYGQYKSKITEHRQFLDTNTVGSLLKTSDDLITHVKYGLRAVIEKSYLTVDFLMREICEAAVYAKGSVERVYKPKRTLGKLVLIENSKGRTFIVDKDTKLGFLGFFWRGSPIESGHKYVCGTRLWPFAKTKSEGKTVYELL